MRILLIAPLVLAACGSPSLSRFLPAAPVEPAAPVTPTPTLDPTPPPRPSPRARTAREFDTTSAEDRAKALDVAPEPAGERRLGETIASLGAPTDPGIWVKTGLVSELTPGRVEVAATGKSANIELRPSGGEAGAGSQISLAAMRLLDIPLTDLPKLVLYAAGLSR